MPTDASGTPTSLGIPVYNPDVDAPSGLGNEAQMNAIDALIKDLGISGLVANDVPVYDSVSGKFVKATGTPSSSTFLRGDGSWAAVTGGYAAVPNVTVSAWSGGPPGSPSNNDIWIATTAGGISGVRWAFQYNDGGGTPPTYPWEYIGGGKAHSVNTAGGTLPSSPTNLLRWTGLRAGGYTVFGRVYANVPTGIYWQIVAAHDNNAAGSWSSLANSVRSSLGSAAMYDTLNGTWTPVTTTTGEIDIAGAVNSSSGSWTFAEAVIEPVYIS